MWPALAENVAMSVAEAAIAYSISYGCWLWLQWLWPG